MADRTCPHCQKTSGDAFFWCGQCGLLSHVTILFTGPVLSMKSVTASYLHRRLKIGIVESAYYGAVGSATRTEEALRSARRARVIEAAMVFVRHNLPVIVDAAYHRRDDRLDFVRHHREASTQNANENEIICVCCYAEHPDRIKYRLEERNTSAEPLEVEHQDPQDAEDLRVGYQKPSVDEPYPVVYFDTDKFTVEIYASGVQKHVKELLVKIKEHIDRAVAIGRL